MKIGKEAAMENLVRVCEESLALIRHLIESQELAYATGYEDGMETQKRIHESIARGTE
jgi:hypothetical protein